MTPAHLLLALLVVAVWGFNFVVIAIGLHGFPPILLTALRFAFTAVPAVFFVKRPMVPIRLFTGYAGFQFGIQFALLFGGMKLGVSPGLSSLVMQLQAFFTIALAVFFLHERPRPVQFLGALVAFSGMALVAFNIESRSTLTGFILVVGGALSWGIGNIFTKLIGQGEQKVDALALVVWGSALTAPPLFILSLLVEGPATVALALGTLHWQAIIAVLFQAYAATIVGYGAWSILVRSYPAAMIAPFTLLVPVFGMLSAAFFLNEPLQWWKLAAGLLVLAGLGLNHLGGKRTPA